MVSPGKGRMVGRGSKRPACLSVAVEATAEASRQSKRVQFAPMATPEPVESPLPRAEHPTAAERTAAQSIIEAMKNADVQPPLLQKNSATDPAVVACALALHFDQKFVSDRVAKSTFRLAGTTDVRNRWVNDKLARLREIDPGVLDAVAAVFPKTAEVPGAPSPAAAESEEPPVEEPPADVEAPPADAEEPPSESPWAELLASVRANHKSVDDKNLPAFLLLIKEGNKEYMSRKHLQLWSKAQYKNWAELNEVYLKLATRLCRPCGPICPRPSQTVINRDYEAAQLLPWAAEVIELYRRREHEYETKLAEKTRLLETALRLLEENGLLSDSASSEEGEGEEEAEEADSEEEEWDLLASPSPAV